MSSKRVYSRDIAILIAKEGFKAAAEKYAEVLTPLRARSVIAAMKKAGVDVPDELVELAKQVRAFGHKREPPAVGEERKHRATTRGRVSVYGAAIGIKAGTDAIVKYESDRIVVTKPSRKRSS